MLVLVLLHTRLVHTVLELVFAHTVLVVRALQTAPEPPLTTYLMLSTAAPFVGVWQQHFFCGHAGFMFLRFASNYLRLCLLNDLKQRDTSYINHIVLVHHYHT